MPKPPKTYCGRNANCEYGAQLWSLPRNRWHREDGPHLVEPGLILWGQHDRTSLMIQGGDDGDDNGLAVVGETDARPT